MGFLNIILGSCLGKTKLRVKADEGVGDSEALQQNSSSAVALSAVKVKDHLSKSIATNTDGGDLEDSLFGILAQNSENNNKSCPLKKKEEVEEEIKEVAVAKKTMASPSFFYEDEVYRKNKFGDVEFGMVTENWEMYSSSDEDEDDPDRVPPGHCAVTWYPKGKDEVIEESKIKLSDRSLMPGDVVRRLISGKDTQRGYCRSVRVAAAVQMVGTKKVFPSIIASELKPVQKLQGEVAVYLDSWVGVIRDIQYKLTLKFADNSICCVDSYGLLDNFIDTRRSDCFGNSDTFYPGQRLKGPMHYLREAEWINCSDDLKRAKDRKSVVATVTDVEPSQMTINWQWQTPESPLETTAQGDQQPASWKKGPPPDKISGDNLKRIKCLNLFESCTVQLGDISFYTPNPKEIIIEKSEWKKSLLSGVHTVHVHPVQVKPSTENNNASKNNNNTSESDLPSLPPLVRKGSFDLVKNKDESNNIASINENSTINQNQQAQLPSISSKKSLPKVSTRSLRKKKLKKTRPHNSQHNLIPDTKIVVETIHTQSVVDVVWQDGTIEEEMQSIDLFPIHHLDDHEFFPGDFVVKADSIDFRTYGVVQNMDHAGRVAHVKWFEAYSFTGEQHPTELESQEMSVYDIKDHPDFRFRPGTIVIRVANILPDQLAAGQILDNYPNGQVKVWWANEQTNYCWPQDLFRLGEYDSDEGEIWDDGLRNSDNEGDDDDDDIDTDSSWETEAEEEMNEGEAAQRYHSIRRHIENIQKALVSTREKIIASTPVSAVSVSTESQHSVSVVSSTFDRHGIARKLLLIYKDCQYLDKMMGTKFFNEDFLKDWFKKMQIPNKLGRITEQVNRLFDTSLDESKIKSPSTSSSVSELKASASGTSTNTGTPTSSGEGKSPMTITECDGAETGAFVTNLCSLILNKLLAAHTEYQKRFGEVGDKAQEGEGGEEFDPKNTSVDPLTFADNEVKATLKEIISLEEFEKMEQMELHLNMSTTSTNCEDSDEKKEKDESGFVSGSGKNLEIEEVIKELKVKANNFNLIDGVADTHRYRLTTFLPQNQKLFLKTIQKEIALLRESLPDGIFVKGFEDRIDLYSAMILGPEKTPYEDGIFMFDIQLPPNYPNSPPIVHYVSFCPDRLNPNLYECGKVCVSLLGTWSGKGTEIWTSSSSLLQLLISIQGLILVKEPYYNEAGYEKQRGSQQGEENSRMYNEMVLIKLVQSMSRMLVNLNKPWEKEIVEHLKFHGPTMISRFHNWFQFETENSANGLSDKPDFPLFPVSKGFSITLKKLLENFSKLCEPAAHLQNLMKS